MTDSNTVALIYPHMDALSTLSRAIAASPFSNPPPTGPSKQGKNRSNDARGEGTLPYAKITFDHVPRTSRGILVGSSPACDIVLREEGVSLHHVSLTFDQEKRLIVKDWGSSVGTQVTYDSNGAGERSRFQWIVGGNKILNGKTIIVKIHRTISFQIIVPDHDITCPEYIKKVDRFYRGSSSPEDLLQDLDLISHPATLLPTGANTPGTGDIYLAKRLGQGSFGEVTHMWNVGTGEEYALKTPSENAMRRGDVDIDSWRREARIMSNISHAIALVKHSFTPKPQLFLEYVPGGSLEDHINITHKETLTILRQSLSALDYLHGQMPPIVHRDIKPANILVQHRSASFIFVKLGDFGVSQDNAELMTICGTCKYLAPEMYQGMPTGGKRKRAYDETVDIWSLGVVAYELMSNGLPRYAERYKHDGMGWCETIAAKLRLEVGSSPNALNRFLLDSMLVMDPGSRFSARDAYNKAMNLSTTGEEVPGSEESSPVEFLDSTEEDKETMAQAAEETNEGGSDNPPTMVPDALEPNPPALTGHELSYFERGYSSDPLDTLYVGSSLAELGEPKQVSEDESSGAGRDMDPVIVDGTQDAALLERVTEQDIEGKSG